MLFGAFSKCFCKNSFASLPTYKEAIYQIIEVRDQRVTNNLFALLINVKMFPFLLLIQINYKLWTLLMSYPFSHIEKEKTFSGSGLCLCLSMPNFVPLLIIKPPNMRADDNVINRSQKWLLFPVSRWKVFKVVCRRGYNARRRAEAHAGVGFHWVSAQRVRGLCTYWYVNTYVHLFMSSRSLYEFYWTAKFFSLSCRVLFVIFSSSFFWVWSFRSSTSKLFWLEPVWPAASCKKEIRLEK